MVSLDTIQSTKTTINKSPIIDQISSPRISFSSEFLDDSKDFISICPKSPLREISTSTNPNHNHYHNHNHRRQKARNVTDPHFEFLSSNNSLNGQKMITADELFFEGKLLPFWQAQTAEKLKDLKVNDDQEKGTCAHEDDQVLVISKEIISVNDDSNIITITTNPNNISNPNRVKSNHNNTTSNNTWFVDDDPSPRPPKCTVLWKELLRLKKQRATSTLSPSSSSSSSSSSASSMADIIDEKNITTRHSNSSNRDHHKSNSNKGVRKGLERTRSATIRIRPMINVPICSQVKSTSSSSLPPLFPLKKGKLFDR